MNVLACETLDRIFLARLGEIVFRVCNRLFGRYPSVNIRGEQAVGGQLSELARFYGGQLTDMCCGISCLIQCFSLFNGI